jgi:hypothetical protein
MIYFNIRDFSMKIIVLQFIVFSFYLKILHGV